MRERKIRVFRDLEREMVGGGASRGFVCMTAER